MRVRIWLFLTAFLIAVLGGIGPVAAEQAVSAKQQMINSIKESDITFGDHLEGSSGAMHLQVKELSGVMVSLSSELKVFKDANMILKYKLNPSQKKLELGYRIDIDKETYLGSLFADGSKIIFTRDVLKLVSFIEPRALDKYDDFNHFVYFQGKNFGEIWESFLKSDKKDIMPAYRELIIFFVEAVPDKYFSSADKKVLFSMDSRGVEECIYLSLQKIKNEKARFAALVANLLITQDPSMDAQKVKEEIIKSIDVAVKEGSFPGSAKEVKTLLWDFSFDRLSYETALSPAGGSNFTVAVSYADKMNNNLKLAVNAGIRGSKDNSKGLYDLQLNGQVENFNIKGSWKGNLQKTGINLKENDLVEFNMKDKEGNTLGNLAVQVDTFIKNDSNVPISIPPLTRWNSTDLNKLKMQEEDKTEEISVVFDGKPMTFDVPPYIKGGRRVMVPVRNLAESLGCEVAWQDPNEVRINRDNVSIVMYVDKRLYSVNGVKKILDMPPVQAKGRILVPLRFMVQELGCRVIYDDSSKTVYIYSTGNLSSGSTNIPRRTISFLPKSDTRHNTFYVMYTWTFEGREFTLGPFHTPIENLNYYRKKPHPFLNPRTHDIVNQVYTYTSDPDGDKIISAIVSALMNSAAKEGYDEAKTIEFVVSFVQGLPYVSDKASAFQKEYPKYPVETLLDRGGDCEDTALLTAVLLRKLGHGSALLFLPGEYHAAVGVLAPADAKGAYYQHDGKKYLYLETTNSGWKIGQIPKVLGDAKAYVIPLQ